MPVVPYTAMQRPAKPASASHPAGAVQTRTSKRTLPAQLTRDQNTTGLMAHLQQVSSLSVKEWAEWHKEWHISEKRCRAGQLEVCVCGIAQMWEKIKIKKEEVIFQSGKFICMPSFFFFFFCPVLVQYSLGSGTEDPGSCYNPSLQNGWICWDRLGLSPGRAWGEVATDAKKKNRGGQGPRLTTSTWTSAPWFLLRESVTSVMRWT